MYEESISNALKSIGTVFVFDEVENRLIIEASNCSKNTYMVYENDANPEPCSLSEACKQLVKNLHPGRWLWAGEPNSRAYKTLTGKYHISRDCMACPKDVNEYSMMIREYTYVNLWCKRCANTISTYKHRKLRWLTPEPYLMTPEMPIGRHE